MELVNIHISYFSPLKLLVYIYRYICMLSINQPNWNLNSDILVLLLQSLYTLYK